MAIFSFLSVALSALKLVDYVVFANVERHFVQENTTMAATLLQLLNKRFVLGLGTLTLEDLDQHTWRNRRTH